MCWLFHSPSFCQEPSDFAWEPASEKPPIKRPQQPPGQGMHRCSGPRRADTSPWHGTPSRATHQLKTLGDKAGPRHSPGETVLSFPHPCPHRSWSCHRATHRHLSEKTSPCSGEAESPGAWLTRAASPEERAVWKRA